MNSKNGSLPGRASSVSSHQSAATSVDDAGEKTAEKAERNSVGIRKGANYIQTLANMLNGFIGSGILTMPSAFKDAGLLVAAILNPCVGMLSCLCIHMLVHIDRHAMKKNKVDVPYTYAELGWEAFFLGPKRFEKYAKIGRIIVTTSIIMTAFGGCCVYFIFVATNLEQVSD